MVFGGSCFRCRLRPGCREPQLAKRMGTGDMENSSEDDGDAADYCKGCILALG